MYLAHSKMKLCLFVSYTYKRKSIRVFRTPILVYLDVRGVEIPLLSTVSISNCRYQEAPGEVVWSVKTLKLNFLIQAAALIKLGNAWVFCAFSFVLIQYH